MKPCEESNPDILNVPYKRFPNSAMFLGSIPVLRAVHYVKPADTVHTRQMVRKTGNEASHTVIG